MPRFLYPPERALYTHWIGGWMAPPPTFSVWTWRRDTAFAPASFRTPNHPAPKNIAAQYVAQGRLACRSQPFAEIWLLSLLCNPYLRVTCIERTQRRYWVAFVPSSITNAWTRSNLGTCSGRSNCVSVSRHELKFTWMEYTKWLHETSSRLSPNISYMWNEIDTSQ